MNRLDRRTGCRRAGGEGHPIKAASRHMSRLHKICAPNANCLMAGKRNNTPRVPRLFVTNTRLIRIDLERTVGAPNLK